MMWFKHLWFLFRHWWWRQQMPTYDLRGAMTPEEYSKNMNAWIEREPKDGMD